MKVPGALTPGLFVVAVSVAVIERESFNKVLSVPAAAPALFALFEFLLILFGLLATLLLAFDVETKVFEEGLFGLIKGGGGRLVANNRAADQFNGAAVLMGFCGC